MVNDAIVPGHIVLTSGHHAFEKFEFDKVNNRVMERILVRPLGGLVLREYPRCNALLTVANGANRLGKPIADVMCKLTRGYRPRPLQTRKPTAKDAPKKFWLPQPLGNNVLRPEANGGEPLELVILDDAYTRGTNVSLVAQLADRWGAIVLGAAVIYNRNPEGAETFEYQDRSGETILAPLASLVKNPTPDYTPADCPQPGCQTT